MNTEIVTYRAQQLDKKTIAIQCSNGAVIVDSDPDKILSWLTTSAYNASTATPRAVWNLAEFVACIKSVIPDSAVKQLESNEHRAIWWSGPGLEHRIRLYYQPSKFFAPNYDHREINIYDLDQFFPDNRDPQTVEEVQAAADELSDCFASLGVPTLTNLRSPVAVMEDSGVLDWVYGSLPDPEQIPAGCKEYACLSDMWGAWTAAYQLGYWDKAYSYDVASCYPGQAVQLASLDGARYEFSHKMLEGALYGFLKGDLYINPEHPFAFCSPIVAQADTFLTNPTGNLKSVYVTIDQVRFVEQAGLGTFKLKDGWFVYPQSGSGRPLDAIMQGLYSQRLGASPLVSQVVKRIIDGIIGRLGEYHQNQPTANTNPLYHSTIRSGASIQVGRFLTQRGITQDELIHVATDGIHTTRDLGLPPVASMGKWRSEGANKLLVLCWDRILEGDSCDEFLSSVKASPSGLDYDFGGKHIDMISLEAQQTRAFARFPQSGKQLVSRHYMSKPIVMK